MRPYTDLVFPKGNEEKLVMMAKRLGLSTLILCYPLKDPLLKERKSEVGKLADGGLATVFAILVTSQGQVDKARSATPHIVARGEPWAFEDKRVRYVIDYESGRRPDFIHHRNSGLNQVFINQAKRAGTALLVNARQLFGDHGVIMGRMLQNNTFYRKYKPDVMAVSGASEPLEMRAPRDLQNLLEL